MEDTPGPPLNPQVQISSGEVIDAPVDDVKPTAGFAESGDSSDEVVKSVSESFESWDHIEPLEDVISASDSEGREFSARASRGGSPDGKFSYSTRAATGEPPVEALTSKDKGGDAQPSSAKDETNPRAVTLENRLGANVQASGPAADIDAEKRQQSQAQPGSKRSATTGQLTSPPRAPARKGAVQNVKPATGKSQLEPLGVPKSIAGDADAPATPSPQEAAAGMRASTSSGGNATSQLLQQTADMALLSPRGSLKGRRSSGGQRHQELQEPQSGGGWGWGSWTKLSEQIREAAEGAVRDVHELTASLQQAIAEGHDDETDDSPGPTSRATTPKGVPGTPEHDSPESEAKRRAVLEKLEGDDTVLDAGLKVMDESMEQLAVGMKSTLGSLWGGARGVIATGITLTTKVAERVEEVATQAAKELVETVEEGVADVRGLSMVKAATVAAANTRRMGGLLASKAELGLEQIGRQAIGLLEGTSEFIAPNTGAAFDTELSFDHCFYVYGGRQSFEELEALGNECARQCNRLRTKLAPEAKDRLDAALAKLGPFFDLQGVIAEETEMKGEDGDTEEDKISPVGRGHSMVADLCSAGVSKAAELAVRGAEAAAQEAAVAVETTAGAKSESGDEIEHKGEAQADGAKPGLYLESLKGEAVRRLSELASLCIERLLALGRSVSATFRHGRAADDGIWWPESAEEKAAMLRLQARRMVRELEFLTRSFLEALAKVGDALQGPSGDGKVTSSEGGAAVSVMRKELESDFSSAAARVGEAFRGLMYVVLLATQDRELLQSS